MHKKSTLFLVLILSLTSAACGLQRDDSPTVTPPFLAPSPTAPTIELPVGTPTGPSLAESSAPESTATDEPTSISETVDEGWWSDAVFYEVFVRSFQDSDGDGIGDIDGLIERLDYLNDGDLETTDDLGVNGIWLMPIMESPSYHGYDVVDYFKVDEEYGTEEDFRRLIEEAHARGINVIVDLVMNHTSRDHPWFQESRDPDSEFRDWYIWADENPGFRGPQGQQVWHADGGDYYYGLFWEGMPDLNLENPDVATAMYEAARFWLEDMGVDGFRLDAIKHLVEEGANQENTPATHAWLEDFHTFYKGINPEAITVGEAWAGTKQVIDYTGDEVDIAFQFDLAQHFVGASQVGLGSLVQKTQSEVVESFPPGQYAIFLTNHDQDRLLSQLDGDESAAKVAASFLLTSPGVPFIYYGEEIGMIGQKPDEDIRRPMQWTAEDPGAGFTEGQPWRPPYEDFPDRNIAEQEADPDSLLNHYRALIRLRNEHSALRGGQWLPIQVDPGRLYAALRHDDAETLLVLINPSDGAVTDYRLSLPEGPLPAGNTATLIFGEGDLSSPEISASGGFDEYKPLAVLPPQSTFVVDLSAPQG